MSNSDAATTLNLKIIQKHDPSARNIYFTARHVVLYAFSNGSWVKAEVEGALFIYGSLAKIFMIVLNRLNFENFHEQLDSLADFQLEGEVFMFSTVTGMVYSLWFFHESELLEFCQVMNNITDSHLGSTQNKNDNQVLEILQQAQVRRDNGKFRLTTLYRELYNRLGARAADIDRKAFLNELIELLKSDSDLSSNMFENFRKFVCQK